MLAPFRGRPLIDQVLARFDETPLRSRLVLLTSLERTDDPLADYVENRCHTPVFRGALDDVVGRFQAAAATFPSAWVVRISGDSPLMDAALVAKVMSYADENWDLVSNVVKRTFPAGQSVECLRSASLLGLRLDRLTPEQREHVTKVYYDFPGDRRVRSIICSDRAWAGQRMVVDSLADLKEVEQRHDLPPSFGDLAVLDGDER